MPGSAEVRTQYLVVCVEQLNHSAIAAYGISGSDYTAKSAIFIVFGLVKKVKKEDYNKCYGIFTVWSIKDHSPTVIDRSFNWPLFLWKF